MEGSHKDAPELREGGRYHGQTVNYAMHKFAYYVCHKCKAPYFGGYRSCEVAAGEGEQNAFDARSVVMVEAPHSRVLSLPILYPFAHDKNGQMG